MKKTLLSAILALISTALIGCGGGGGGSTLPPVVATQILSDPAFDGDILQTSPLTFIVTQGMSPTVQSVFAGVDPLTFEESRAFLDFPLTGPNGVPGNAAIVSATLDIVINNVFLQLPGDTIPIRIELVDIPGLTLAPDDFSRTLQPALAFTTIVPPVSSADIGGHVSVDVTSLMVQAQNSGLPDFQVRVLEDLVAAPPGLIEINDTTGVFRGTLAPLLKVEYF